MELSFRTKALRDTCASGAMLNRKFGPALAEAIRRVLADLRAASSIQEVAPGDVAIDASGNGVTVKIGARHCLRLEPNHMPVPADGSGRVDWTLVSRVKLMGIEASDG
jgi:hypothetical protein